MADLPSQPLTEHEINMRSLWIVARLDGLPVSEAQRVLRNVEAIILASAVFSVNTAEIAQFFAGARHGSAK